MLSLWICKLSSLGGRKNRILCGDFHLPCQCSLPGGILTPKSKIRVKNPYRSSHMDATEINLDGGLPWAVGDWLE